MVINVNYIEAILLGVGLAMDASAVSAVNGFTEPKMKFVKVLFMAFLFGSFQGFMPMIGYAAGSLVVNLLSKIIPYIALILLSYLGGKMIYDGVKGEDEENEEISTGVTIKTLLLQSVATSIDALSIGLIFSKDTVVEALIKSGIIDIVTFIISVGSFYVGKYFGTYLNDKAQIFGGVILILIGLKIFYEYLKSLF
ncbi:putative membrane protein [Anaeromyces robustus]|uniref:Putative membrane protein n=1 Tax=Anaeromyces robustus TaxID=1754192 RepID=A0A1Y1WQM9_9FUNG|nr:putative membrane protein [Anaeromyces robustus]|eukprot:ORX75695.1 putative membrane protein [Anaeromyces robustus]